MSSDPKLLGGVRVLDFTVNAAGPNATWFLSSLGADVIKVESHGRQDPARQMLKDRPYLHSAFYEDVNTGKRCITLDMKSANGQKLAMDLVGHCDVLVDSFRPGVMDRLGLGYEEVHERFPKVVVASLSATGSNGPLAGLPGYAGVFNALGGLGSLTGYEDGPPTELRVSVDFRAGAMFALQIAWALQEARRTGCGARVDFSAAEAVSMLAGEYLTGSLLGAEPVPDRIGNHDDVWAPQGIYPSADSKWMALTVRNDAEWASLSKLLDEDGLEADDRYSEARFRKADEQILDALLAQWSRLHSAKELDALLHGAHIPSGQVMDGKDLWDDEHLRKTDCFRSVQTVDTGDSRVMLCAPWLVNGRRRPVGVAHRIGQDTHDVLSELLGLSPEQIDELETEGALSKPEGGGG